MRISIEDFITLLEQELSSGTSTEFPAEKPAATFDYNQDLLYKLYRDAKNDKNFSVAYAVLVYANEHKIQFSKELA